MGNALQTRLDKLLAGIISYPDLHTKELSLGARVYESMELVDGEPYYFRISFDWDMESKKVKILSKSVVHVHGPH